MQRLLELYLMLFHFWMRFPEKIRFLLVGGYNTVISYALYALFLWISQNDNPQLSLFFSFLVSSLNSYLTQKFYVFNTRGNYCKEYLKCLGTWAIGYVLNALLLLFLTDYLEINPYGAQLFAAVLITINSYILLKYFAFKDKNL